MDGFRNHICSDIDSFGHFRECNDGFDGMKSGFREHSIPLQISNRMSLYHYRTARQSIQLVCTKKSTFYVFLYVLCRPLENHKFP